MVSRALRQSHEEILIHTGQHYDLGMSDVFFSELDIPQADVNLGIGSGGHGSQTGRMLVALESQFLQKKPQVVVVYGDTNSTLAGALAAAKLGIPVAHVEAGLRSFRRSMPEEINRVVTDHVSELLFCPSSVAVRNLKTEGIVSGVHLVGDVMFDALTWAVEAAGTSSHILSSLSLVPGGYVLATIHRAQNTDDPHRLSEVLHALDRAGEQVVFPVHPRTREAFARLGWRPQENVLLLDPVGYLDMVQLLKHSRLLLTDSGGLQKEAYWLKVPCITVRDETEWIETVQAGWNVLVEADTSRILETLSTFSPVTHHPVLYGEGQAAQRCAAILDLQAVWPA